MHYLQAGDKFGKLTLIESIYQGKGKSNKWLCSCDCGNETKVFSYNFRNGNTTQCADCVIKSRAKNRTRHGDLAGGKCALEYSCWIQIKMRCYNKKNKRYERYGGRGITVCDKWLNDYSQFLKDMGRRPDDCSSIDRIDNDGNYEPGNCKWANVYDQAKNKSNNVMLTLNGKTTHLLEWERITGIKERTIARRLKIGWSHEKALTHKVRSAIMLEFKGERKTIEQWSDIVGISHSAIRRRMKKGLSMERILAP